MLSGSGYPKNWELSGNDGRDSENINGHWLSRGTFVDGAASQGSPTGGWGYIYKPSGPFNTVAARKGFQITWVPQEDLEWKITLELQLFILFNYGGWQGIQVLANNLPQHGGGGGNVYGGIDDYSWPQNTMNQIGLGCQVITSSGSLGPAEMLSYDAGNAFHIITNGPGAAYDTGAGGSWGWGGFGQIGIFRETFTLNLEKSYNVNGNIGIVLFPIVRSLWKDALADGSASATPGYGSARIVFAAGSSIGCQVEGKPVGYPMTYMKIEPTPPPENFTYVTSN